MKFNLAFSVTIRGLFIQFLVNHIWSWKFQTNILKSTSMHAQHWKHLHLPFSKNFLILSPLNFLIEYVMYDKLNTACRFCQIFRLYHLHTHATWRRLSHMFIKFLLILINFPVDVITSDDPSCYAAHHIVCVYLIKVMSVKGDAIVLFPFA